MPTLVVKYSALVSDDNHCPTLRSIQPPRKFKTKVEPLTNFSMLMIPVFDPTNVSLVIRG